MAKESQVVEVDLNEPDAGDRGDAPAGDEEGANVPVQKFGISLPQDLHSALQRVAEDEGVSVSEVCKRAIADALKDNPERLRKRIARQANDLAGQIEAAEKAGHVKDTKAICESLRAFAKRVESQKPGEPAKPEPKRRGGTHLFFRD